MINDWLYTSLGVPASVMDGAATFSGHKITEQIFNRRYAQTLKKIENAIWDGIFKPESVCTSSNSMDFSIENIKAAMSKLNKPNKDFINGNIRSCNFMCDRVQTRFPRSKKKRIRNKWAKKAENYGYKPWNHAINIEGTLYMHPTLVGKLRTCLSPAEQTERLPHDYSSG